MNFTRKDLIRLLRKYAMYNAAADGRKCSRLNGFMLLEHKSDLNADSPLKEQSNYFFRGKTRYPMLTLFESEHEDIFFKNCKDEKVRYELGVIDQKITDCDNCDDCEKRDEAAIYDDTKQMLQKVVAFIKTIKCYKKENEAIWESSLFTATDGYVEDAITTNKLQNKIRRLNKSSRGGKWRNVSKDALYGNFNILNIPFWECGKTLSVDEEALLDENCC